SSSQTGLPCGTPSTFGVVAVDVAGNRSSQASTAASTISCPLPPPPLPPPPAPPSGVTAGTGIMALGCTLGNFGTTHLPTLAYVLVSGCDAAQAAVLPGRSLHYFSPGSPHSGWTNGEACGGDTGPNSITACQTKGWIMKDAAGNYVHPYNDSGQWVTDIG